MVAEKADRYGLRAFAEDAVEVFQRWMEEDEPDDNNPVNRQVMRKVKKNFIYSRSGWKVRVTTYKNCCRFTFINSLQQQQQFDVAGCF